MFKQILGIYVLVFVLYGGSVSTVLKGETSSAETSKCSYSNKVMKIQNEQVPRVETQVNVSQDANITASFHVGFTEDNNMAGSIKLMLNEDKNRTNLIVRLTSLVHHEVEDTDYFLIQADSERNGTRTAYINCIQIPPSPNTTIIAEVFQISLISCDCHVTIMATSECLHLCHMYPVSTHTFLASTDACYYHRKNNHDTLYMNLKAEMISSTNITRFRGYFRNVNPFSTAFVSIFPDNYEHSPHVPLLTLPVKVNAEKEIFFSKVAQSLAYCKFYAKLTISCSEEDIPEAYLSDTARARPYTEGIFNGHTDNYSGNNKYEKLDDPTRNDEEVNYEDGRTSIKTEIVYCMVIGLICTCCIITVIVWLKIVRGNRRRIVNLRRRDVEEDLKVQLYTSNKVHPGKAIYTKQCQNNQMLKTGNDVMILYHPDTNSHRIDVEDLIFCLQKYDIHVHDKPEIRFQNWRDFAEKAGEKYKHVIIILSSGLVELCEIYKTKDHIVDNNEICDKDSSIIYAQWVDKRWNELLEQRHGEYIPCVALDKLRSVIQDRRLEVGIHFVTFCDTDFSCQNDQPSLCDRDHLYNQHDPFTNIENNQNDANNHEKAASLHKVNKLDPFYDVKKASVTKHHENHDDLLHSITINSDTLKHCDSNDSITLNNLQDHSDYWDFINRCIFLQTKHTHFHTISRKVMKYLADSENGYDTDADTMNSLSLLYTLKNLR